MYRYTNLEETENKKPHKKEGLTQRARTPQALSFPLITLCLLPPTRSPNVEWKAKTVKNIST